MRRAGFASAPLYADLAEGPPGGEAFWLTTADGLRIRAGVWPVGAQGTVLLYPGRTEYVEKYVRAAADLGARGYACVVIDWRGQGLADRLLPDRMMGHVARFGDYQHDVQAVVTLARGLGLPEPYYLLAHSMGGAIGLRSLIDGLPVKAAAFSAPMWGIVMAAWLRPLAQPIAALAGLFGQANRFAPGTTGVSYLAETGFGGNVLTTDPEMWHYMKRQVIQRPELALAGPSLAWVGTALAECHALRLAPAPACPVVTALGTAEKVVDVAAIRHQMARWRGGQLVMFPGAEHEILMETPAHRTRFLDLVAALFSANR